MAHLMSHAQYTSSSFISVSSLFRYPILNLQNRSRKMWLKIHILFCQKSLECADCMLVEIGEKSSFFGNPCDSCGITICFTLELDSYCKVFYMELHVHVHRSLKNKQHHDWSLYFQASIHALLMSTTRNKVFFHKLWNQGVHKSL